MLELLVFFDWSDASIGIQVKNCTSYSGSKTDRPNDSLRNTFQRRCFFILLILKIMFYSSALAYSLTTSLTSGPVGQFMTLIVYTVNVRPLLDQEFQQVHVASYHCQS